MLLFPANGFARDPLRLLALFLLVALSSAAFATPTYVLQQVQIVHRHGARSPIVSYNETAICGTEFPCGYLNRPGQTMLRNAGAFLRERYTQDASVVDPAAPFLDSDAYNLTVSYSRSTDVLRTLQSSVALLRGLFPDMDSHYPAIHSMDAGLDTMLSSDAKAAVSLMKAYGDEEERAACQPLVDDLFPAFESLLDVAREVHSEGYCEKPKKRHKCAKKLCSIGQSYESQGTLANYPNLERNLPKLCNVSLLLSRTRYGYNTSKETHLKQGSVGQELAQEIIANARAFARRRPRGAGSPAAQADFKVLEYSAHDTTLVPLAATLGDGASDDGMLPPYATTYVFELLRQADHTDPNAYFIRVLRGYPGVTPASGYVFAWHPFTLRCTSADGSVYVATDNVCPVEDFARFVDSSKPQDEAGLCYVDPAIWERAGCERTDKVVRMTSAGDAEMSNPYAAARQEVEEHFEKELTTDCLLFRQRCPRYACAEGYTLDAATYRCRENVPEHTEGASSQSAAVADETFFSLGVQMLCGAMFLTGAVVFSVGIDKMVGPCGGRDAQEEEEEEGEGEAEVRGRVHPTGDPLRSRAAFPIRQRGARGLAGEVRSPSSHVLRGTSRAKGPVSAFEMALVAAPSLSESRGSVSNGSFSATKPPPL